MKRYVNTKILINNNNSEELFHQSSNSYYINYSYSNWYEHKAMPRGIIIKEHLEMMNLLGTIADLFRKHSIQFMISEGYNFKYF